MKWPLKFLLLLFLASLVAGKGYAKKEGRMLIDSLLQELPKQKGDTSRVKILNDLSYTYYTINPDTGIRYGLEGMTLATKLLGPRRERRHALGESGRRGADEAAARKRVESARPLADEMRRRLEPGAPADAATGQQRNPVRPDEPARRLRSVARVGVLGQQADETTVPGLVQVLVQRREQKRQNRLRDARSSRQRGRERLQPLELEQLPDKRVEYGTVHDERRKPGFRGGAS